MIDSEAKVRVRIDTSMARGDMQELTRTAQTATVRVGQSVRDSVSSGLHAIGMGGAIGSAAGAFRAPTEGGISAIAGELFGPLGESFEDWVFGDLASKARADQRLSQEVQDTFGTAIGMNASNMDRAKAYADARRPVLLAEEEGRKAIRKDSEFRSVNFEDVMKRITAALMEAAESCAQSILKGLPMIGGFR